MSELTRHYLFGHGRRVACGAFDGVVTAMIDEVGCEPCRKVHALAIQLSDTCGCRRPVAHCGVALWKIEERGELT